MAVGGDELIIVDGPLRLELSADRLGRKLLDLLGILRIFAADGVLKGVGLLRLDLQNIGKAKLADDLQQHISSVNAAFFL